MFFVNRSVKIIYAGDPAGVLPSAVGRRAVSNEAEPLPSTLSNPANAPTRSCDGGRWVSASIGSPLASTCLLRVERPDHPGMSATGDYGDIRYSP